MDLILFFFAIICSIRGTFLSALFTIENFGVLLAYVISMYIYLHLSIYIYIYIYRYIIGEYFEYHAMPLFSIILTAVFALLLFTIPESPIYLVRQKKFDVSRLRVDYIFIRKKR